MKKTKKKTDWKKIARERNKTIVEQDKEIDKIENKYDLEQEKTYFRGVVIGVLIMFFVGLILMLPIFFGGDVDEQKLCQDKIDKYFPEYDVESVRYSNNNGEPACVFTYKNTTTITPEIRDGLEEVLPQHEVIIEKRYKLINSEDLEFVRSDNRYWAMFVGGVVLWGFTFFVIKDTW